MAATPALFPKMLAAIEAAIQTNAEEVTALDQAIGDGDHVSNLERGLHALDAISAEIAGLDWVAAWQKIGMSVMSSIGGASGSLYATLFIALNKNGKDKTPMNLANFADVFTQAVEAVKKRGRTEVGEKTMVDVLSPVAETLQKCAAEGQPLDATIAAVKDTAVKGMESTRDMLATKGRASFLGERTRGHIDAGARTAQLMICAVAEVILAS